MPSFIGVVYIFNKNSKFLDYLPSWKISDGNNNKNTLKMLKLLKNTQNT